jgi:hypothetical protein
VLFNQLFELGILEKRIVGVLAITAPIGTQAEKDIFILLFGLGYGRLEEWGSFRAHVIDLSRMPAIGLGFLDRSTTTGKNQGDE